MKHILILIAALSIWHTGNAQFSIPPEKVPHISRGKIDMADFDIALQTLGVEVFKFTLPIDTLPGYNVIIHIDEYRADSLAGSAGVNMGNTYLYFTEDQGGPFTRFSNTIRLICNGSQADKPVVSVELVGAGRMGRPVEWKTEFPYATRPFAAQPLETGKKMPLLMYGSFWKDERGIVRFCGRNELEPDDEMMHNSPHYYIFSAELKPAE